MRRRSDPRRLRSVLAALALAAALLSAPAQAGSDAPSPERQRELLHLLRQDCGSCHGYHLKGGLGPPLLPGTLAGKDVDALAAIILDGVPGTPMPPWRFEVSPAEARWLAGRLLAGLDAAEEARR
ncbi:hypothetical protein HRbin39_00044 [bacterium HR39]|nr:hypothetical protein HRbin39_00044 [bacterium HR39]